MTKLILEIMVSVILHPLAVILVWLDLAERDDLIAPQKIVWGVFAVFWGIGPILYILVGDGELW